MYINTKYIYSKELTLLEFSMLQVIKQNRIEDMSDFLEWNLTQEMIDVFADRDYIDFVNPKKKSDTKYMCIRTTSKANELLEYATTPAIEEGDEKMAKYLMDMYTKVDATRVIGNKKKVIQYTAEFRKATSLSLHEMYWLCDLFINEVKYTQVLEKIFFDANKHRYAKFINHLEDSKLYQFLEERRVEVESYWKEKIKE